MNTQHIQEFLITIEQKCDDQIFSMVADLLNIKFYHFNDEREHTSKERCFIFRGALDDMLRLHANLVGHECPLFKYKEFSTVQRPD